MRVEGVEVEFPADVGGAVGTQDVEGEAAEPGKVAGFVSKLVSPSLTYLPLSA